MQRSVGVTISAIVALLGSLLALVMGLLTLLSLVVAPARPPDPNFPGSPALFRTILFLVPLFYLLPAAWGITTSIGLFRLRHWARISIIVFAALLALFGLFSLLGAFAMLAMPAPPTPPGARVDPQFMANFMVVMRVFMVVFALAQLGIGIWWLVFFNRVKVKEQFTPRMAFAPLPAVAGTPPPPSLNTASSAYSTQASAPAAPTLLRGPGRPVSITIIGWYLLVGALLLPLNLFLRTPAALLVNILTGWQATAYFLAMLGVHAYVGVGLLRLQPVARLVGIAYFVFGFVNSAVFFFAPGGRGRMAKLLEVSQSAFFWMRQPHAAPFDLAPFMMIGAVMGMLLVLVPLCFLIINRQAFARPVAQAA